MKFQFLIGILFDSYLLDEESDEWRKLEGFQFLIGILFDSYEFQDRGASLELIGSFNSL